MSEKETQETTSSPATSQDTVTPEVETTVSTAAAAEEQVVAETTTEAKEETTPPATASKSLMCRIEEKCPRFKWVLAAIAIVALLILSVLYRLEREGRSSTQLFAGVIAWQENSRVVANVNGEQIKNGDLKVSIEQFSQMAAAQGVDIASTEAQAEMRSQALEVLINTTLLKQEAAARAVAISDEEVEERINAIREEIGGAEVLAERMESLGINDEKLRVDVRDELTIQKLLDQVFAEANIQITEEEIASVYEGAGGKEAGLPALEEVRAQVEAQVRASKEQAAIDDFLTTLKEKAEIETK
jgi:hypothetical protein